MTSARRYTVHGRVQGVGYRYFAKKAAERLGLTGYARNLPDGTVEILAIGEEANILDLLSHLQKGPAAAEVREVKSEPASPATSSGFEVR